MKHHLIRKILSGISLTTALFIFQACYGTPQDVEVDVNIKGVVKSDSTGNAIPGIKIILNGTNQTMYSDTTGAFSFYTPMGNTYRLIFTDADSTQNGLFTNKDTVILNNESSKEINLEVFLQHN